MTSTSDGSRPDPRRFLTEYAQGVENAIRDLQSARLPEEGDYAMRGLERRDIKGMIDSGVIQV